MKLPSPLALFSRVKSPRVKRWMYYGLLNAYLPHFGAGIRFTYISPDFRTFRVRMKLHFWNRNFVGTQFGGSLYSMCDAAFMLMLLEVMGDRYVIWDKAATIRFRRPGRGTVTAEFHLPDAVLAELHSTLAGKEKHDAVFHTQVLDGSGEVVAEVEKVVHFRPKSPYAQPVDRLKP